MNLAEEDDRSGETEDAVTHSTTSLTAAKPLSPNLAEIYHLLNPTTVGCTLIARGSEMWGMPPQQRAQPEWENL